MLKRYSAVAASLLLLGTVSLVGCESTGSPAGQVPAQAQSVENTTIIKSPNDDRQYSAVMLANG
jgi:protease-3